jgi:hypothetical protein
MPPADYLRWQGHARGLLGPLAALMEAGRADLPLRGRPSDHDAQADRLESFARPLFLAALYLQTSPEAGHAAAAALREKLSAWLRAGLVLGADPASPEYWGPDANYHQHHVEMGLMAIGLGLARAELWEPLAAADRALVMAWFATARGGGIVNNNHLFMSVHILEFLGTEGAGRPTDRAIIEAHLDQLETMHRRHGWFEDGANQAYDHYNAYAFHFYGLFWVLQHGHRDPARAARWRGWARDFTDDYQHAFAASGEHPAFGRSIAYRFNACAPFALAVATGATDLPLGRVRRLCTRNVEFFLARPITDASTGCLAPGFTDVWPEIVEGYSCPASPYWCAKGFTSLLLPADHPYWSAPEAPLPSENPVGFVRAVRAGGLVLRGLPGGEVELLNAGSMVSNTHLRYGAWKWSKLSYRTGVGFTYAFPEPTTWSADGALIARWDDGPSIGRHSTTATALAADHLGFVCNLGQKIGQLGVAVETWVFWRAGWLLQLHRVEPRQPVVLSLGGFALPLSSPAVGAPRAATDYLAASAPDGRAVALQNLGPTATPGWDERPDEIAPRRHTHAPFHLTPVFTFPRQTSPLFLAALAWSGRDGPEAEPWSPVRLAAGDWMLAHPALGEWRIVHDALPKWPVPNP